MQYFTRNLDSNHHSNSPTSHIMYNHTIAIRKLILHMFSIPYLLKTLLIKLFSLCETYDETKILNSIKYPNFIFKIPSGWLLSLTFKGVVIKQYCLLVVCSLYKRIFDNMLIFNVYYCNKKDIQKVDPSAWLCQSVPLAKVQMYLNYYENLN